MTYLIYSTSGNLVATVNNSTLNQQYDIDLIGKNYTNYGQPFNDNLFKIMENFSNLTPPPKAVNGQLWFNKADQFLYVNKGDQSTPVWVKTGDNGLWTYDIPNFRAGWNCSPEFDVDVNATFRTRGEAYINAETPNHTDPQNGLVLGTVGRDVVPGTGDGTFSILSNDSIFAQLQGKMALITSPQPAMRRLSFNVADVDLGSRNITLAENGGFVGVNTDAPVTNFDVYGNVSISGINRRIWSDYSNATVSARTLIQSNIQDGITDVGVIPNAAGTTSSITLYANSDADNSSYLSVSSDASQQLNIVNSNFYGTGQVWPMTFNTTSEAMRIMPDRNVGVHQTMPNTTVHITSEQSSASANPNRVGLLVESEGTNIGGRIGLRQAGDENPWVLGYRSRGSLAAPTTVQTDDNLLGMMAMPYDGMGYEQGSSITLNAAQAWTTISHGSDIRFFTVQNGKLAVQEAVRISHKGYVGINDTAPETKLTIKSDRLTDEGIRLSSERNEWVRIMADMPVGLYNPIVESGDSGIIYGGNVACQAQGFVIAPWGDEASGIRLDHCGNLHIAGNFDGGGLKSGLWEFSDSKWSGIDPATGATLNEGGWEWQGTGAEVTFGISAPNGELATLYVDGGIRQAGVGKTNYMQDYTGFGNTDPQYQVDVFTNEEYPMFVKSNSDLLTGVIMDNNGYQWEYGIIGPNIPPGLVISEAPADSFYVFDDIKNLTRLLIDPDGKTGISINKPLEKLHVFGGNIRVDNATDTSLKLRGLTGFPRSTVFTHHGTNNDTIFRIDALDSSEVFNRNLAKYDYDNNMWSFSTANSPRLTITSNGSLYCNGATGNGMGPGTINATGLYINGVPVSAGQNLPYPVRSTETWNPAPQPGQGVYYWATNDSKNFYLYNTSALHVAVAVDATNAATATFATSAGTATTATTANGLNPSNNYQVNSLGVGTAASGLTGEIRATNNITAYYSSDIRLKTNITNISNPLDRIAMMRGVEFDWTDEYIASHGGEDGMFIRRHDVGVIAQEVENAVPEVVVDRPDGYKAVNYEKLVAVLIEAVNELQHKVEQLEARLK